MSGSGIGSRSACGICILSAPTEDCCILWFLCALRASRYAPPVRRHVLSPEPPGARVDAAALRAESPRCDVENCRVGLQYRGRGLFDPLDYPIGATGSESRLACFLCHMAPAGVDLDVRTKVALDLGLKPMQELTADIHDGARPSAPTGLGNAGGSSRSTNGSPIGKSATLQHSRLISRGMLPIVSDA
jgi:hypothetical protein